MTIFRQILYEAVPKSLRGTLRGQVGAAQSAQMI
jgi:hypothetical protein